MMDNSGSNEVKGDLVPVRTFRSESEATIAKGTLEAFGIDCMLSGDDCGGQRPHLLMAAGIRLLIRPEDAGRADEVLASQAEESG